MLDDFDFDDFDESEPEGGPPEESDNRTFLLVAGGLGVVVVLVLIVMAVYAFFVLPNRGTTADTDANATIEAQNAAIAQSLTETAIAQAFSPTPSNTPLPTNTPQPTNTSAAPLITDTPGGDGGGTAGPTADPRTATVESLLTQAAVAQTQAAASILTVTPTPTAVSSLPDTGLLDDLGTTGLMGIAALLLIVIFTARRLRDANS
jgi:Tfp pilus assembly protein PilX